MFAVKDYEEMRTKALAAISNYIKSEEKEIKRACFHGFFRSGYGLKRAKKLQEILNQCQGNDKAILGTLFALFGAPHEGLLGWKPFRSSHLVELIADQWIQGNYLYGGDGFGNSYCQNKLSSSVFSIGILGFLKRNYFVLRNTGTQFSHSTYFDKIRAVRVLLQQELNAQDLLKKDGSPRKKGNAETFWNFVEEVKKLFEDLRHPKASAQNLNQDNLNQLRNIQINPKKQIISSYSKLKELSLQGINEYKSSTSFGQKRAERAKTLLEKLHVNGQDGSLGILAVTLAIFGKPDAGFLGWKLFRSNVLARLIANQLINGIYTHSSNESPINKLASSVFEKKSIEKLPSKTSVISSVGDEYWWACSLDKTKGVRVILQKELAYLKLINTEGSPNVDDRNSVIFWGLLQKTKNYLHGDDSIKPDELASEFHKLSESMSNPSPRSSNTKMTQI